MPTVTVLEQSCKGVEDCGICTFVCPASLFSASEKMNTAGYVPPQILNQEKCTGCRNCMIYCPDFSIVVQKNADGSNSVEEKEEDE
ncbi:MAG: 4Fe-4S binding protein [Desulfobacteraceae bacterium]|nr:4Fe-4S binding protein [Desulfobacteraceae bacterium]